MAKKDKKEKKEVTADKIYTIPLRKAHRRSYRKISNAAMKIVKGYILTHTKADDVKIGHNLAEFMTAHSRRIPRKVRVNVFLVEEDGVKIAQSELLGKSYTETKADAKEVTGTGMADKLKARLGQKALQKQEEEEKIEGKTHDKKKQIEEPSKNEVVKTLEHSSKETERAPARVERKISH